MAIRRIATATGFGGATGAATGITTALAAGTALTAGAILPFAALGGGLGFIASLFAPGKREVAGQRFEFTRESPAGGGPAVTIFGRRRWAGRLVYSHTTGSELHRAVALSEGEIDGIEALYVNEKKLALKPEIKTINRAAPGVLLDGSANIRVRTAGNISVEAAAADRAVKAADLSRFTVPMTSANFRRVIMTGAVGNSGAPAAMEAVFDGVAADGTTFGGFGAGPHLRNPGDYAIVLRSGARTEAFPFLATDNTEPHELVRTHLQAVWLESLRARAIGGETVSVDWAWIDLTEWDSRVEYKWAFETTHEIDTGALIPDSDLLEDGDRSKKLIVVYPYLKADGTGGESLREATEFDTEDEEESPDEDIPGTAVTGEVADPQAESSGWTSRHKLNSISWAHVVIRQVDDLWAAAPQIDFLIRGIKTKAPRVPRNVTRGGHTQRIGVQTGLTGYARSVRVTNLEYNRLNQSGLFGTATNNPRIWGVEWNANGSGAVLKTIETGDANADTPGPAIPEHGRYYVNLIDSTGRLESFQLDPTDDAEPYALQTSSYQRAWLAAKTACRSVDFPTHAD